MKQNNYNNLIYCGCFEIIIKNFEYKIVAKDAGIYLFKIESNILFHIYERLEEIYFDVYDLLENRWGIVDSIIVKELNRFQLKSFLEMNKNKTLPELPNKTSQDLLSTIDILVNIFPDLLNGKFSNYESYLKVVAKEYIDNLKLIIKA